MGLLSIFILWPRPAFWSRDIIMCLVLSAFTSSPISLVAATLLQIFLLFITVTRISCLLNSGQYSVSEGWLQLLILLNPIKGQFRFLSFLVSSHHKWHKCVLFSSVSCLSIILSFIPPLICTFSFSTCSTLVSIVVPKPHHFLACFCLFMWFSLIYAPCSTCMWKRTFLSLFTSFFFFLFFLSIFI